MLFPSSCTSFLKVSTQNSPSQRCLKMTTIPKNLNPHDIISSLASLLKCFLKTGWFCENGELGSSKSLFLHGNIKKHSTIPQNKTKPYTAETDPQELCKQSQSLLSKWMKKNDKIFKVKKYSSGRKFYSILFFTNPWPWSVNLEETAAEFPIPSLKLEKVGQTLLVTFLHARELKVWTSFASLESQVQEKQHGPS